MIRSDRSARQVWAEWKANPKLPPFGMGERVCLLNVDLQRRYTDKASFASAYEANPNEILLVNQLAQAVRTLRMPVVWTYVAYLAGGHDCGWWGTRSSSPNAIQNVGHDGTTDFSFTVNRNDFDRAKKMLEEQIKPHIGARAITGDNKICKVSAVGVGMRSHPGVASKMFRTLAEEGINIQMISTSEIKISVVVDEKYLEMAVRVVHRDFELDQPA